MTDSIDLALKIMALVDESPSEPFSFERKQIELKLEEMIARHTQQVGCEIQESYDLGYDEGKEETEQEYEDRINDLEDNVHDLETEVSDLRAYIQTLETDN